MANALKYLYPSSADTWTKCHGYAALNAAYPRLPREETDVREDGIACHWLVQQFITQGTMPPVGTTTPNNRIVDESMVEAATMYMGHLQSWGSPFHVESRIDCSTITPGMTGYADAYMYEPGLLRVCDFKYGFKPVEPENNLQLVIYALSILAMLGVDGITDQFTRVELSIVQPRAWHREGHIRTWSCMASDLRALGNILRDAAARSLAPNPQVKVNSGCKYCRVRNVCPALHQASGEWEEIATEATAFELQGAALGMELMRLQRASEQIEARLTGLQVQAEQELRSGKIIPGWQLKTTFAREAWREGQAEAVIALGKYYNVNLAEPTKAVSPAKARKLLPENIVKMFSHTPSTGVRLAKVDATEAAKRFK